mmetsp:Transcript_19565/g.27145  ORF Transcript_19565/g.27145 Transcript_19565/m.27145 type:complete len:130 (+) Transcript_19565:111-500(+)
MLHAFVCVFQSPEKTLLTEETRVDHQQRQSEEGKNENSLLERQFMDSERRIELLQRQLMDSREHIHLLAGENSSLRARLMAVQKEKHDLEERIESLQAHVVSFNRWVSCRTTTTETSTSRLLVVPQLRL